MTNMKPHNIIKTAFNRAAILAFGMAAIALPSASAQSEVSNGAGSGAGSLRDAIGTIASGGTITFGPAVTTVATSGTGFITTKVLTINGSLLAGEGSPTIDAAGANRHFVMVNPNPASLTLSNLQLINAKAVASAEGAGATAYGGSIYINSTITTPIVLNMTDVAIKNSVAGSSGGAVYVRNGNGNGIIDMDWTRVSITGNSSSAYGGVLFAYGNGGIQLDVTDSVFRNNTASNSGGVFRGHSNKDVRVSIVGSYFDNNQSSGNDASNGQGGGVIQAARTAATTSYNIALVSSTFSNNAAAHANGRGGVLAMGEDSAGSPGNVRTAVSSTDSVFTNNRAGRQGGVIYAKESDVTFAVTQDIQYTGNYASNGVVPAPGAAAAQAGGFYYGAAGGAGNTLNFIVDGGATLTIGSATGGNAAFDSIATAAAANTMTKSGAGALILNADNSYYQGAINVTGGRLLLGNADAKLGGVVSVASGGGLGGVGTAMGNVTVNSGLIQIGVDDAAAGQTLRIAGEVTLVNSVTLAFDHYAGGSDLLSVNKLSFAGGGTSAISLNGYQSTGVYTLIKADTEITTFPGASRFVSTGLAGRLVGNASLANENKDLIITLVNGRNYAVTWTGATGATQWNDAVKNWSGTGAGSVALDSFMPGDRVIFDSVSDAAHADARSIAIGTAGVTVADMFVSGNGNYTFVGNGAITASSASVVGGAIPDAAGKLVKDGEGTLTFENASNAFAGGVEIKRGAVAVSSAAQLGAALKNISFTGDAATGGRIAFLSDVSLGGNTGADARVAIADGNGGGLEVAAGQTLEIGQNNNAAGNGGAINVGGGVADSSAAFAITSGGMTGSTLLSGNSASMGGAIYNTGSVILEKVSFSNNTASANGGAIYNAGYVRLNVLENTTAAGNSAAGGGFLYMEKSGAQTPQTDIVVAGGKTLVLGAVADADKDALASASADAVIAKSGGGMVVSHANNAGYLGQLNVNGGAFLLGATGGGLGGNVSVGATGGGGDSITFGGIGTIAGNVAIGAGSTLQAGIAGASAPGTLIINGDLDITSGILKFGIYDGQLADQILLSDGSTLAGMGTHTINIDRLLSGTYNLGNVGALYDASMKVLIGGQALGGGGRQTAVASASGGDLMLAINAGVSAVIKWTGKYSAVGDLDATKNWVDAANAEIAFAMGDRIVFDSVADTAQPANRKVRFEGTQIVVSDVLVAGEGNYTFTGAGIETDAASVVSNPAMAAAAAGKLIKEGAGTLMLSNSYENNFKGGVDLKEGALALGSAGALGGSNVNIKGAGTVIGNPITDVVARGALDLATFGVTVDTSANLTFSGTILGEASGALAKTGTGSLMLAGANTFAGGVQLNAGTLVLGNNAALGSPSGVLTIGGENTTVRMNSALSIANNINVGAHGTRLNTQANNVTLSGVVSGAGDIVKAGNGALKLTESNAYTGAIRIIAGAVEVSGMENLGDVSSSVFIDELGTLQVSPGATGTVVFGRKLQGAGILAVSLASVADRFGFDQVATGTDFQGTLQMRQGTIVLDAGAASALGNAALRMDAGSIAQKNAGDLAMNALALNGGTLELGMKGASPDGLLTVKNLSTGVGVNTIKLDTSALVTSQTNPAIAPQPSLFDQDAQGAVKLVGAENINGTGTFEIVGLDGTPLALDPTTTFVGVMQGGDASPAATAGYNYTVMTKLDGLYFGYGLTSLEVLEGKNLILDNAGSSISTLTAAITGTGGIIIRAAQERAIVLNGANAYEGDTLVESGILRMGAENILSASRRVVINQGAALDLNHINQTINNISGSGDLTLGTGTATLRSTEDSALAGNVSGDGKIIKSGAAGLTLSGSNTYRGGTDLAEGRLIVASSRGLGVSGTNAVTLADGTVLEFSADSGTYRHNITGLGGRVEATRGVIAMSGTASAFGALDVRNGATVFAMTTMAAGGGSSIVTVHPGSALASEAPGLKAGSLTIDGGMLLIGGDVTPGSVDVGSLAFLNNGGIALTGALPGGQYTVAQSAADIIGTPVYETLQNGMYMSIAAQPRKLVAIIINQAIEQEADVRAAFDTMHQIMGALHEHVSEAFLLPMIAREGGKNANNAWVKGFGTTYKLDSTGTSLGYRQSGFGMMAGYDRAFGKHGLLGFYGAAEQDTLRTDDWRARTKSDNKLAGVYGSVKFGRAYFSADYAMGRGKIETERREGSGDARASYDRKYIRASAEFGLLLSEWKSGFLKPAAAIHYMRARFDERVEYGPGAMIVPSFDEGLVQSYITMQASQSFTLPWGWSGMIDLLAGFRQDLSDGGKAISASFVSDPHGVELPMRTMRKESRGTLTGGLGTRFILSDDTTIGIRMNCETGSEQDRFFFSGFINFMW